MELTKIEKKLNELINSTELCKFAPERDKLIIDVLKYVSTISQSGELEILLNTIQKKFPEYGY